MAIVYYFSMLMHYFWVLRWHDGIEIAGYSLVIYYFSLWLSRDKQKNLVFPFYAYCFALCATKLINLFTIHFLLLYAAPVVFMLFILLHQQLLQKNFIILSKVSMTQKSMTDDWLEILMRSSLYAINHNKSFFVVIEQENLIEDYISTPCMINAPLSDELIDLIVDSPRFNATKMLWLDFDGKLKSVNAVWQNISKEAILDDVMLASWQQSSLVITQKTDALVISIHPEERLFTLIAQGKIMQQVSATALFSMLRTTLVNGKQKKNSITSNSKGIFHESFPAKSSLEQTQL